MHIYTRLIDEALIPAEPYILLVDDQDESLRPLGELVQVAGFRSLAAMSAHDALACCVRSKPTVMVTDLVMPGKDGRELARRVRRHHPALPMLLVTGQDLDHPDWSVPAGLFQSIFAKPLDFDRFLGTLARLMPSPRCRGSNPGRP